MGYMRGVCRLAQLWVSAQSAGARGAYGGGKPREEVFDQHERVDYVVRGYGAAFGDFVPVAHVVRLWEDKMEEVSQPFYPT